MSRDLLSEAAWWVDARAVQADRLLDLSDGGRDAVFGAGAAAPVVLPWNGEDWVYVPGFAATNYIGYSATITPHSDVVVEFDMPAFTDQKPGTTRYLISTARTATNHIDAYLSLSNDWLHAHVGGTGGAVVSSGSTPLAGDRIKVVFASGTLTLFINDVQVGTGTGTVLQAQVGTSWIGTQAGHVADSGPQGWRYARITASGDPVLEFRASSPRSADYSSIANTGTWGGNWTISRAATGLKTAVVDRPLLLFGPATAAVRSTGFSPTRVGTVLAAWRKWPATTRNDTMSLGTAIASTGGLHMTIDGGALTNKARLYGSDGLFPTTINLTMASHGPHTFGAVSDGAAYRGILDGAVVAPTTGVALLANSRFVNDALQIGYSTFAQDEFLAMAFWDRPLTDAEIAQATAELLDPSPLPPRLYIDGAGVSDITIYDVTIDTGRDDVYSQPDGSVLSATMRGFARAGRVGAPVKLVDHLGVLFHGWITDLTSRLDAAMTWTTDLTAVGPLAMLGHATAGAADYPPETDTARVIRVLDEAGAAHLVQPGILGPIIMPRAAAVDAAEKLARSAADDGMGVLWEDPSDETAALRYTPQRLRHWAAYKLVWDEAPATATWDSTTGVTWSQTDTDHVGGPAGTPPYLHLDPHRVLAQATFTQQIGDLARTVIATYGPKPESGERPSVTVGDDDPVKTFDTQLMLPADATAYANNMLRRTVEPAWRIQELSVPLHKLAPADAERVRGALAVGTRLEVPFPHGSPIGLVFQGFVEGWKHRLHGDAEDDVFEHWIDFRVSERSLTEPSNRWMDIDPAATWDTTSPSLRWRDALVWEGA